jgi:hypothetical protein
MLALLIEAEAGAINPFLDMIDPLNLPDKYNPKVKI